MPAPAIDTYSRFYQGLFDDRNIISISKGGLSFFGGMETDEPSETHFIFDQEIFDIEIIFGDKVIAAMIPRGITGEVINDETEREQEWTEFNRSFPLAQKRGYLSAKKIIKRMPGEPPYQPFTQQERARMWLGKQHLSRIRQLMGLQELLAWSSLLEGKMPAILDTTKDSEIYDFRRDAANIITVSTDWAAAALDAILDDIDDACDKGRENGKVVMDMIILGRGVWTPLLLKTGIEKYFDLRRINQGTLDNNIDLPPRFNRFTGNGGLEPRGRIVTPKGQELWVFSYNQHYERPQGTPNYYLPEDQALLAYSGARADRLFGPGEMLPNTRIDDMWYEDMFGFTPMDLPMPDMTPTGNIFDSRMYHFHAYKSQDNKGVIALTQTAPVYVTYMTNAFVTLKGLLP
jgi:hypothetical protein